MNCSLSIFDWLGCDCCTTSDDIAYLEYTSYQDTVVFMPPITQGKVVKVYDGDTITIASKLNNSSDPTIYRFSIRLAGIDTPELKGSNPQEKKMALDVRNVLSELIMNKAVMIRNLHTEKYGRILADVYLGDLNLSKYLLDKNMARPYHGGKKSNFT